MSVSLLRSYAVRRALGALVVAGFLGAGVTGCSNDAGAKTENTVDGSPTPVSTPTDGEGDGAGEPVEETPAEPEQRPTPVEPEAMKTGDKAGAIAAAQYFVEVIEYSMHTSTTDLLEKYSYEHCDRCAHFVEVINTRQEKNVLPKSVVINSSQEGHPEFRGEGAIIWRVPMRLQISEQWETGKEPRKEDVKVSISVANENGRWVLVGIVAED
ncbi:DUF6318 family protein [Jonesia denitrificans]|uniref:DUF6318 domain-containing protein n=1 Tax=Jonesia denitrificans (strain ATCC 14870 / DSM 20603 / BCRC 15368 / CIP 55.134 / JCM 11481 / NBRC 15587 / NCTC 10816 / Prevot 55134) TaxID=471856 RepID=C7R2G2_JONDD|nr:DUF6318 family protein [Jonesia denitrificans]ACV08533.1 hypothetical protein Jden_0871 [Jonesia denitrificans DSM 20603]ASE10002.1 hypothetical protein CEP80_00795 [Jonesia denitrificans]QXB42443.1 hypothetical protein I6L70_07670 [Jonesia denitrificans]SQH20515.1 Uncharacterised protein [Jonesia denitrificans]